jgi:hypothetical protein
MPVIPVTWEAEVGGSRYEASLGQSERPYLKTKLKQKKNQGWGGMDGSIGKALA